MVFNIYPWSDCRFCALVLGLISESVFCFVFFSSDDQISDLPWWDGGSGLSGDCRLRSVGLPESTGGSHSGAWGGVWTWLWPHADHVLKRFFPSYLTICDFFFFFFQVGFQIKTRVQDLGHGCISLVQKAGALQITPSDSFTKRELIDCARTVTEKVSTPSNWKNKTIFFCCW